MGRVLKKTPKIATLHQAIAEHPKLDGYFSSGRRQPHSEHGIFRHYKALDG